ncbi:MAG: hypothetical protein ABF968_11435 [Acetobacter sp.]|uniref:hypothetical protein n=1 Tax=Acetobacter sp. TaxID=440 RepID=UPI0039E8DD8A
MRRVTETKVGKWGVLLLLQIALFLAALAPAQATMLHAQGDTSSAHMDAGGMAMAGMAQSDAAGSSECADHHHAMSAPAHSQHCSVPHHAYGPDCCMVGGCVQFSLTTDLWSSAVHGKRLLTEADYHSSAFGLPAGETAMPALPPPRTLS